MRIAFVHNKPFPYKYEYPLKGDMGGAALSCSMVIREGEKRGHQIDIIVSRGADPSVLRGVDLVILNHIPGINPHFINYIKNNCLYVRHDHQYDMCREGVATMAESICFVPNNRCKSCKIAFNRELHQKAILNVYQSPFHKQVHEKILDFKDDKFFILPPPIETSIFKIRDDIERENDLVMLTGTMNYHKGLYNVVDYIKKHPELRFELVGRIKNGQEELSKLPNFKYIGKRRNYQMPEELNRAKYYLHLPKYFEPSSRGTMEAWLCGCILITNQYVGTMSFDWDWNNRKQVTDIVSKAPKMFWDAVEKVVRSKR